MKWLCYIYSDEKNIPAVKKKKDKKTRISRADEDK